MSAVKIKDPAHAVRVLEALVEQGQKYDQETWLGPERWEPKDVHQIHLLALVEGAKALLEIYKSKIEAKNCACYSCVALVTQGVRKSVFALAQAYAPRMAEAGMEVPK